METQDRDDDVETTIVTMTFDTTASEGALDGLYGVLAKYVVLARGHDGCRNIDLCRSVVDPGRVVVIEKWASPAAQQAHFDSADMVEMARNVMAFSTRPPTIDLLEGVSAHDLA